MRIATVRQTQRTSQGRRRHRQSVANDTDGGHQTIILCPRVTKRDGVIEAMHALYYLPQNYRLVINTAGARDKQVSYAVQALSCQSSIMDRVTLTPTPKMGTPEMSSPFLSADVVLYGTDVAGGGPSNTIVVFDLAEAIVCPEQHNVITAARQPEAIASAILAVVRRRTLLQ